MKCPLHRDHTLDNLDEIINDETNEQKLLEDIFTELKSHRTSLVSVMDKKKFEMTMNVRTHFEGIWISVFDERS